MKGRKGSGGNGGTVKGGMGTTRERRKSARQRWTNNRETAAKFFN